MASTPIRTRALDRFAEQAREILGPKLLELRLLAVRGASPSSHRERRCARLARRDDREYREYLREEQRSQTGCSAARMQMELHHGLPGSEARGEAGPDSDLDVLVVVQPDTERAAREDRVIDIAFDVNLEFGLYISPRMVTPGILNDPVWREMPFLKNVVRESIPL